MTIEKSIEKLAVAVEALAAAIVQSRAPVAPPTVPAVPSSRPAEAQAPASQPVAPAAAAPAPTAQTVAAAPVAPAAPAPAANVEELVNEAKRVTMDYADINREAMKKILAKFGAAKAGEVAATQLPSFIAEVKAALNAAKTSLA